MDMPFQRQGGVYTLGLWMKRGDPERAAKVMDALSAAESAAKGEPLKPSMFSGR